MLKVLSKESGMVVQTFKSQYSEGRDWQIPVKSRSFDVQNEFQASQECIVRLCLKRTNSFKRKYKIIYKGKASE